MRFVETEVSERNGVMKRHVATLCGPGCCPACPEVFVDENEAAEKQVSVTDDFGHSINMSKDQFRSLVDQSKAGTLDL